MSWSKELEYKDAEWHYNQIFLWNLSYWNQQWSLSSRSCFLLHSSHNINQEISLMWTPFVWLPSANTCQRSRVMDPENVCVFFESSYRLHMRGTMHRVNNHPAWVMLGWKHTEMTGSDKVLFDWTQNSFLVISRRLWSACKFHVFITVQ